MASQLIRVLSYEARNQLELSLRQAFDLLQSKLRPPFSLTIPDPQEYTLLNQAILYGVLIEPYFAKIHIKHLHAIVIDGYKLFLSLLVGIVNELYGKLVDSVKEQLIWVTKEMIDVSATGIDSLLVCLMRQIVGGDFCDGNLWLCFKWNSWHHFHCDIDEKTIKSTDHLITREEHSEDFFSLPSTMRLEWVRRFLAVGIRNRVIQKLLKMSILWEKSETWRWLVRRTRDSKPFFLAFATLCGVVLGVIGYGVMQLTNSRNPQLEARLRENARPESLRKEDTNDRYVAALRGETLTRTPYQRIQPVPKQNAEKKSSNNEKA
ncbi:hypothetical protein PVK06_006885 [Gossypium arboreum]|uniref:Integrator complex subunit 3 N-terminal domain-containing protein n=1 Tax=Gossypium arboreum TaxID=29729 RepID=A0ABR0QGQ9_GOSAR|nr:hypothetical protein PVK06_006885 [Gossypium arboreum]